MNIKMYTTGTCGACAMVKDEIKELILQNPQIELELFDAADESVKDEIKSQGATGLPFIVINGETKMSGWQPTEKIKAALGI